MLFFPIAVDVPLARLPWMNWLLMAGIGIAYFVQLADPTMLDYALNIGDVFIWEYGVEISESPLSWIGHMFLHGDFVHLAGNMIFMWVFGNAVCAKVGNLWYPFVFFVSGVIAGAVQTTLVDAPIIGASGAINGVVGFYLIYYPLNHITMAYWFIIRVGTFALSSYWMILLFLAFDIWGAASGGRGVGYFAHLGGFAIGAGAAALLCRFGIVTSSKYERSIFDVMTGEARREASSAVSRTKPGQEQRLYVRVRGRVVLMSVSKLEDLARRGKGVGSTPVSEDGKMWLSFGQWLRRNS